MKLKIEIDRGLPKEVIIRAPEFDAECAAIQRAVEKALSSSGEIALRGAHGEFFVPYSELFFFEAGDDRVYAHTSSEVFTCQMRLAELEEMTPRTFCRASKSVLINTSKIRSITRSPTGVGEATFNGTAKITYISRMYFKSVREIIEETRLKK